MKPRAASEAGLTRVHVLKLAHLWSVPFVPEASLWEHNWFPHSNMVFPPGVRAQHSVTLGANAGALGPQTVN